MPHSPTDSGSASSVPPEPRRLPAPERREMMLQAARETFARSGFAGARTRDIAEAAGVTEGMLFRYFSSKEQLFEEAVAVPLQQAVQRTVHSSLPAPPVGSGQRGTKIVREHSLALITDLLDAMREMAPLLGVVLFSDSDRGQRYYQERIEPSFAQLRDVIQQNLPSWLHREFDPDVVIRVVFAMCWMCALDERLGSGPGRRSAELAPILVSILFDGIAVD